MIVSRRSCLGLDDIGNDLILVLEIAGLLGMSWKCIPIEPQSVFKKVTFCIACVPVIVTKALSYLKINFTVMVLKFFLEYKWLFCAGIAFFAILPPCMAWLEQKKYPEAATKKYVVENLIYNAVGAAAACGMFIIATGGIDNIGVLADLHVEDITLLFVPICLWMAFSYQYEEQQNELEDHSPSLKWKNQVLNVLYLTNVYFWSLVSSGILISYTLYCHVHHVPMRASVWYLVLLNIDLIFFYLCGISRLHYLYLLFQSAVPAIMICSVQWLSWFEVDRKMSVGKIVFIMINFGIYLLIALKKESNIAWKTKIFAFISFCGVTYCFVKPMPFRLESMYFGIFTLILILLYICGLKTHRIFYQVFLTAVPAVLIGITQWTPQFVIEEKMLNRQAWFIVVHFSCYMLIIFLRERNHAQEGVEPPVRFGMIPSKTIEMFEYIIRGLKEHPEETVAEIKDKLKSIMLLREWFFGVVFVIMLIGYPLFCKLPFLLERELYSVAIHHISAICEDEKRTKELLEEIKDSEWYDDAAVLNEPDMDQTQYLLFMYDNLRDEMVQKKVISETDNMVSYEQLVNWYSSYH